ncbi:hypothetical protein [uncultured Lactobacillus sp.]|uniref:hypothetical protein n=1 Tax=uncultured Lactobacillus sp. TaxID=153152 RepID=UPI002612CDCB|nr:hypothetical protein [uncultured Lactobacillus sp.]
MAIVANGIVLIDVDEKGHWTFHSDGKTADPVLHKQNLYFTDRKKVPWAYKFPGKDYYEVESEFVLTVTLHKETGIKPGIYYDAYFTLGDEKFRARRIKVMIEE